jgi:hypothetical protein
MPKANPGKITMGSPLGIRHNRQTRGSQAAQLQLDRCGPAAQTLEKTRSSSSAIELINDSPNHSTNHRHNYG